MAIVPVPNSCTSCGGGGGGTGTDVCVVCPVTIGEFLVPVEVTQGTSPWIVSGTVSVDNFPPVSGTVALDAATLAALETVTVLQGTSPWVVDGTVAATQSGAWTVAVSNFPASVEVSNDVGNPLPVNGTVTANQGTSPWVVSGTVAATQSGAWTVTASQGTSPWVVGDGGGSLTVDGTVTALQGTSPWVISGAVSIPGGVFTIDVSDYAGGGVFVPGYSGTLIFGVRNDTHSTLIASDGGMGPLSLTDSGALNIADNGGSITVDGTVTANQGTSPWVVSGTVAATQSGAWTVAATQSGGWTVTSNQGTSPWVVGDGGGSITVDGTVAVTQSTSPWVVSGSVTATTNFDRAEDSGHTSGQTGAFVLAVRNDSHGALTSTDLDYSPFSVDSSGALNIADNGGSITVDGTVTADTELPAASALADTDPNPTTSRVGANGMVYNGSTWDRLYEAFSDGFPATGNGIPTSGGMIFDGTASVWNRVRSASADNLVANTGLLASAGVVFDGVNWDRTRQPTADGMTVQGLQAAPGMAYNGTTWDRVRSGTAQGSVLVNNPTAANLNATVTGTVTADTELPAASALADADANPTTSRVGANGLVFNGTTWDRLREVPSADGQARTGIPAAGNMLWNGSSWDRQISPAADSVAATGIAAAGLMTWNGASWDRAKSNTGDNVASPGFLQVLPKVVNGGGGLDNARTANTDAQTATGLPAAGNMVYNGTTWDRVRSGGVTGMVGVAGAQANNVAITGNPVLLGGYGSTAAPGATSADGNLTRLWTTRQGTLRAYPSRRRRSGLYHASLGPTTVTAAADAATGGRWWIQNPVGATVYMAIRKVYFSVTSTTGLSTPTAPIFTLERFTFSGTASGATVNIAKREVGDPTPNGSVRTASTGMTVTAGNAAHGFQVPAALATTMAVAVGVAWPQGQDEDEWIILQGGEGLVIRQSTAGTTSDTRVANFDVTWEEFNSTDYQIRD